MLSIIIFAFIAFFEVFSAGLIYKFKSIMHAAIALSFLFMLNSLMFVLLNQNLLAVLQFFIMIGGVSAYIFIGVGSDKTIIKNSNILYLFVFSLLIFLAFFYLQSKMAFPTQQSNSIINTSLNMTQASNYAAINLPFYYVIAFILFNIMLASVILLKKVLK
ncbi:MAG: hypothetical protein QXD11_00765 [Candidatus Micrarchaeaceae archaeon]